MLFMKFLVASLLSAEICAERLRRKHRSEGQIALNGEGYPSIRQFSQDMHAKKHRSNREIEEERIHTLFKQLQGDHGVEIPQSFKKYTARVKEECLQLIMKSSPQVEVDLPQSHSFEQIHELMQSMLHHHLDQDEMEGLKECVNSLEQVLDPRKIKSQEFRKKQQDLKIRLMEEASKHPVKHVNAEEIARLLSLGFASYEELCLESKNYKEPIYIAGHDHNDHAGYKSSLVTGTAAAIIFAGAILYMGGA